MRFRRLISRVAAASVAALAIAAPGAADANTTTQGFLIPNAWLDDTTSGDPLDPPDGVNWSFNSPWFAEPNVSFGSALFITSANNQPGFYAAEASPRDISAEADVLALDGYDPSTTFLTDLIFSDPWRVGHFGTVPADGEYNYFIEYTLETPGGFYRASTQKLDRATAFQNTIVQTDFDFTWEGGGFLGDPFAGGGGIALDQILSQTYNVLVEVITPTSGGDGFFNVEGFNVEYVVNSDLEVGFDGDFNGDGSVDAADYAVWRNNLGATEDGSVLNGNGDGGIVGPSDYQLWRNAYGASAASAFVVAVPEPATISGVFALVSLLGLRLRRCRRC